MNYLLLMPKSLGSIDHFNIFPLGIAYISASLKNGGFNVFTANLDYIDGDTRSILKELFLVHGIDVICTGGLSRDFHKIKEIIDVTYGINPRIISVIGGGIISSDPQPAMRALGANIGVIGEGEITICELAQALNSGDAYDNVMGLIYNNGNNELVVTKPRSEIMDLDTIPFPDFDGFGYGRWVRSFGSGLILTDRSCPFHCTFCFHPTGEKYRQRSLDNIFKEIDYQVQNYGIKNIGLSSELFATNKQRVIDFCNIIIDYDLSWSCCLRVCDFDEELLELMRDSGCTKIVCGLESADNTVLKSMRKGITVEQIYNALNLSYDANLMIEGGFIFGDIKESKETIDNTLMFWRQHNNMHYLNLSMISVLPGSFLYKYACDNGIIQDQEQFLRDGCPLVNVTKLTDSEYLGLRSQITELQLHPHVPSGPFYIESIQSNSECDIKFSCRKCGTQTNVKVWFWLGMEVCCPTCRLVNFIDPFQNALHRQDEFLANLPVDSGIALWGAGGIYYKLMEKYDLLLSENFLLVDANPSLQGLKICGKTVHSPEVIEQHSINIVIITALTRKEDICLSIRKNYPFIEDVLIPAFNITEKGIVPLLKTLPD